MKKLLTKNKDELTKAELKICEYIEEYMNKSIYMTIAEIASGCGVGEASVTRFCKKLGYRSFLEFRMTMAQELQNGIKNESREGYKGQGFENYFYNINIDLLRNLHNNMNYDDIKNISDNLINAKKVHFIGIGPSGMLAENICYKFSTMGINCRSYKDLYDIYNLKKIVGKKEVIFIIFNDEYVKGFDESIASLKKEGVVIVCLISNLMSRLNMVGDFVISYLKGANDTGVVSQIQQNYMLDIIYNMCIHKLQIKL